MALSSILLILWFCSAIDNASAIPASCTTARGALYPCPDGTTAEVVTSRQYSLTTGEALPVNYFGTAVSEIYMTSDGLVLFDKADTIDLPNTRNFTVVEIALGSSNGIMALWSEFDFTPRTTGPGDSGEMSWRLLEGEDLAAVQADLVEYRYAPVEVNWALQMTWYEFPIAPGIFRTHSTFQVTLLTSTEDVDNNGEDDLYVIFNYDQLEQTFSGEELAQTGESSTFYTEWDDDSYFARNGHFVNGNYYELNALSGGASMNYTHHTTNIGVPGRWVIPLFEDTSAIKNYARNTWMNYEGSRMFDVNDLTTTAFYETSWSENGGFYKRAWSMYPVHLFRPWVPFGVQNAMCYELEFNDNGVAACYDDLGSADNSETEEDGFQDDMDFGPLFYANFGYGDGPTSQEHGGFGYDQKLRSSGKPIDLEDFERADEYIYLLSGRRVESIYMVTFTWELYPMYDHEDYAFFYSQFSLVICADGKNYMIMGFKSLQGPYMYDTGYYAGWMSSSHDYGGEAFNLPRSGFQDYGISTTESNINVPGIWVLPLFYVYNAIETGTPHRFTACRIVECLNGGTCLTHMEVADWFCQCPLGFTGRWCESNDLHTCDGVDCGDGGSCVAGINDYLCKYPEPEDPCDDVICENGGTCVSANEDYVCKCDSGYTGVNCTESLTDLVSSSSTRTFCSSSNTCEYTCVVENGVDTCRCQVGYNLQVDGRSCEPNDASKMTIKTRIDTTWDSSLADPNSANAQALCDALVARIYSNSVNTIVGSSCVHEEGSIITKIEVRFAEDLSPEQMTTLAIAAQTNTVSGTVNYNGVDYNVDSVTFVADSAHEDVVITDACFLYDFGSYCENGACEVVFGLPTCRCFAGWDGNACDVAITTTSTSPPPPVTTVFDNNDTDERQDILVYVLYGLFALVFVAIFIIFVMLCPLYSRWHSLQPQMTAPPYVQVCQPVPRIAPRIPKMQYFGQYFR